MAPLEQRARLREACVRPLPADVGAVNSRAGAETGEHPPITLNGPDGAPRRSGPAPGAHRDARHWLLFPGLPMAAILGTGVFLRLWQLTAVGFNSDEAVYAGQAASLAGALGGRWGQSRDR